MPRSNGDFFGRSPLFSQVERTIPVEHELPPAHPKQRELINAFIARVDPANPGIGTIYDESYPNFDDLPLAHPNLRFVLGACGSKFGKTFGCSILITRHAWENSQTLNWWVAPTYRQSEMAYRLVRRLLPKGLYNERKTDLVLELLTPDGDWHSSIEFKSGEKDDNLRGFGVHFAIIDEAARISEEAYHSVWTTTTQTDGKMVIISTPKGRNWFYDEFQKGLKSSLLPGEEDPYPEYTSITMPTWSNPWVKPQRILLMRKNMPADVFEQEIAARFMKEGAGVFRGINGCYKLWKGLYDGLGRPIWRTPVDGHRYVIGVDLARKRDYTVITVCDTATKEVVYIDRFNDLHWSIQKSRIVKVAREFNNAVIWMDGTGVGDPIVGDVQAAGCKVECFIISTRSKQELIEKLRTSIEFQRVTFPQWPILIRELRAFEYDISTSGNIRYSAPSGQHDDCVLSLALANQGLEKAPFVHRFGKVRGL